MGPKRLQYSEEAMDAAVNAVVNKKQSLREASGIHGVPKSSLQNRLNGIQSIRKQSRTLISPAIENRLVSWLQESARGGSCMTKDQLLTLVQSVLAESPLAAQFKNYKPGQKWLRNFLKRHSLSLSFKTPQASRAQREVVTERKMMSWFEKARLDIEKEDPNLLKCPERIYNCCETGFQLNGGISKVTASNFRKNDTRKKRVTVLACGSASGDIQPPLIIFPGEQFRFDPIEGFPEAHFAKTSNGRIDSIIFEDWFEQAFIPDVEHLQKPVLLFADGYKTHYTFEIHDLCKKHSIILYQLPSHSNDIVQPLDLTWFNNLKQSWQEEVLRYQEESVDRLGQKDFARVFKKAWERGIDKGNVISSFKAAGLYPWNPDHIDPSKIMLSSLPTFPPSTSTEALPSDTISLSLVEADNDDDTFSPPPSASSPALLPLPASPSPMETTNDDVKSFSSPPSTSLSALHPLTSPSTTVDTTNFPSVVTSPSPLISASALPSLKTSSSRKKPATTLTSLTALERLLDLSAKAGVSKLTRYRTIYDLQEETNDPEERLFCKLYKQVTDDILNNKNIKQRGRPSIKIKMSDNLPRPSLCLEKGVKSLEEKKEQKKKKQKEKQKRLMENY